MELSTVNPVQTPDTTVEPVFKLFIYVCCLAWYLYLRLYLLMPRVILVTSLPVGVDDVLSGERENCDVDLLIVVVVEVAVVNGPTVQII